MKKNIQKELFCRDTVWSKVSRSLLGICVVCGLIWGCMPEVVELPGSSTGSSSDMPSWVSVPEAFTNYFVEGVAFGRSADEVEIVFKIDVDWMMKVVDDHDSPVTWCVLSTDLGSTGLHKVKASVNGYNGKGYRTCKIRLMSLDATKMVDILILQEGYIVQLNTKEQVISNDKHELHVEVKANAAFRYEIGAVDWVREKPSATRALSAYDVVFEVDENPSHKSRETHIVFFNPESMASDTLRLVQKGAVPQMSVPDTYTNYFVEGLSFGSDSDEVEVVFDINVDWEMNVVDATGNAVSWCNVNPVSGSIGLQSVKVCVAENTTYDARSAQIVLMSDTCKISEIAVKQAQKNGILLSRSEYIISNEATTIDVEVKSNVSVEYEILDADWVREAVAATRSLSSHTVSFAIDENPTLDTREAHIRFYNSEYNQEVILSVLQTGQAPVLQVTTTEYNVSYEGATIEMEVNCNMDVECEIVDANWVRESASVTRTVSTRSFVFEVDENSSSASREAHIRFYNTKYSQEIVVSLLQAGDPAAYEAVDLGLSVKWASYNVGASSPEGYGSYYAWGEIEEKNDYDWDTYKWCNGSNTSLTKYCTDGSYGTVDSKTTLDLEDDVAHVEWGGSWRMPTLAEIKELLNQCTWQWSEINGVSGYRVTGPNGNSIFLPATGYYSGTGVNGRGSYGYYWTSTLYDDRCYNVYYLNFRNGSYNWGNNSRNYGRPVRPVTE